jgi:hypothetical protein
LLFDGSYLNGGSVNSNHLLTVPSAATACVAVIFFLARRLLSYVLIKLPEDCEDGVQSELIKPFDGPRDDSLKMRSAPLWLYSTASSDRRKSCHFVIGRVDFGGFFAANRSLPDTALPLN